MKIKQSKQTIIGIVLIVSLLLNIFQLLKLEEYSRITRFAKNDFVYGIQLTCSGIEMLETRRDDELDGMSVLSKGTTMSVSSYDLTSYYKKNPDLLNTLSMLNDNITNRSNIREVLEKNDLTLLIPALKKVMDFPLDKNATQELDYMVIKHTVIGSPLP